ncbi:MAG: DUF1738 domain-containing protein [Clostridia bacterium]|nr:DUF1738 domain-containing protein [Clostridia bacterium]
MKDVYQEVTDRIIAQLEQGVIPWHKPWIISGKACAISRSTGKPYSLLNQMLLGRPGEYATFAQIQKEGGKIRKGAKAQMVVFWKWIEKEDDENPGEVKKIPFLRYFNVFHIDDCEGLKPKHDTAAAAQILQPDEAASVIITDYLTRSGVKLVHQEGDRAFYRPSTDTVTLPLMEQFKELAEYYSTAFHELTHSTGHSSRLDRLTKVACFGSEDYSKEELVAEIGAAALVNHVGLETASSFRNSAAYVQSWLKALRDDKRLIVSAAGQAEKACSLILNQ